MKPKLALTLLFSTLCISSLSWAAGSLSPSIELPEQGLEVGEFGQLTLRDLPSKSKWEVIMSDINNQILWKREIFPNAPSGEVPQINHLIPFAAPAAGEYEVRLVRDDKWVIRIHLLSENNQLWAGESLHEAVLNMLGVMHTKTWYGSPTTNLPSDDPKFITWVTAREQELLSQISSARTLVKQK